jgi:hypothetical protein
MALLWVLVFLLGGLAGSAGYHFYQNQKPKSKDDYIREMARDLKLDNQQTESLKAIFDESVNRYRALNQQFRPQWRAIRNETDDKIRSILRPDQKLLFEERLKKFRKPSTSTTPATPPASATPKAPASTPPQ